MSDKIHKGLHITREAIESGEYSAEDGVIVLVAPLGVTTVRHMLDVSADILTSRKLPQGFMRHPNDGVKSVLTDTRLDNQVMDD